MDIYWKCGCFTVVVEAAHVREVLGKPCMWGDGWGVADNREDRVEMDGGIRGGFLFNLSFFFFLYFNLSLFLA